MGDHLCNNGEKTAEFACLKTTELDSKPGVAIAQMWRIAPNLAHCMVAGGAFDVLGNLRKCAYICPEKFVTGY